MFLMTQNNILLAGHIGHLKKEGFPCCLIAQWQNFGVRSLSESDAAQLGFRVKVAERVYQSGSGIYFPFTSDFGQLRLDTPITRADGSVAKYLTPIGASSQAYLPTGCQDVTEGWKDAQAGTLLGRVTGALAGVSHYKALPPDSGLNIIFDADGWTNPDVAYHLFNAGLWTKGKIQLLPPIEGQPKAGLCEYRQAGYTADDYQALIESAFSPIEFLFEWASHFGDIPERKIGRAVKLVCQLAVRHLDNAQQLLLLKSIKKSSRLNLTDVLKPALNEARLRWRRSQQAPPKAHHPGELRADWKPPVSYLGTLGYWRTKNDNDIWEPRCNFDFVIDCELSDRDGGGFVLKVKPEWSSRSERVIIKNADKTTPEAFQEAVSKQIGSPVSVSLSKWELNSLFASKHADYRLVRDAKVFRVCERYGQLEDGLWVFSDRQFKADGTPTNERSSQTVFNRNLGIEDYIPCPVLAPDNGLGGIKALIDAARLVFGSEIHQFLLCLGWVVAGLQFQTIQKLEGAFPILNAYGNAGTGKTIAMEAALSVIGANWADEGMFSMATESALYERLKLTGSLPCCWDDPPREAHDVKRRQEFIKAMWNAKRRRTRGNEQKPHSPIALTTNHAEGEEQLAAYTRILTFSPHFRAERTSNPVTAVTPAQIDYSSYPHLTSNDIRASEKRAKKCKSAMLACTNQAELAAFHSEGGFSSSEIDWVYRNLLNDAEKDKVRSAAKSEQLDLFDPQASSHARTDTEREDLLLGARVVLKNKPALSGEVRSIELDGDKWIITVTFDDGTMAWFYRDQLIKLE